jgi:hypothetical protein
MPPTALNRFLSVIKRDGAETPPCGTRDRVEERSAAGSGAAHQADQRIGDHGPGTALGS